MTRSAEGFTWEAPKRAEPIRYPRSSPSVAIATVVLVGIALLYILWKLGLARAIGRASRREAEWVRTTREAERPS